MKSIFKDACVMALAFTLANFIWQVVTTQLDWAEAAERSYFQFAAAIIFAFVYQGKWKN